MMQRSRRKEVHENYNYVFIIKKGSCSKDMKTNIQYFREISRHGKRNYQGK